MADTNAFYRLLDEMRSINDIHKLNIWYISLSKSSPLGNKEEWDKMSERDMKLLVKNINEKMKRLEKSKKSILSKKDLDYLASTTVASGGVGKEIYRQIKKMAPSAFHYWGAKSFVHFEPGNDLKGRKHKGGLKFDFKTLELKGKMIIFLRGDDTYRVIIGRINKSKDSGWEELKVIEGIQVDNLINVIDDYVM